jgi:hypothetical protein
LGVPQWEIDKIEATDNPELGAIDLEARFLEDLEKKMGITKAYEGKDDDFLGVGGGIFGGASRADDPDKILGDEDEDETAPLIGVEGAEAERGGSGEKEEEEDNAGGVHL